jgi:hypothetical protein
VGHIRQGLDVADERGGVGRGPDEQSLDERASHSGQGWPSLDHLLQPGLLPQQVQIRADDDLHGNGAERVRVLHLPKRPGQGLELGGEGLLQPDVGTVGADGVGDDGQALQDLIQVGPQQQPVLEGGRLPLRGVAHRRARAGTDRPDRPPLLPGGESCPSPAPQPASCYLLDHRNGPGGQGGLEPAASSGGLVVAEGSRHQVQKGHGGSVRLPTPFPERPEQPLQLAGYRPGPTR